MTPLERRTALAAGGVAALLARLAEPARAAPIRSDNPALDYVRLRADQSGKPVYWLSRGTRYLLADFQITPLHAMNMASVVAAERKPDGGFIVRALEGSYATDLAGVMTDAFVNPVTTARVPLTVAPAQTVIYHYEPDGCMVLPRDETKPPAGTFEGAIAVRASFQGGLAVEEKFVTRSKTGTLSELITFVGTPGADGSVGGTVKTVVVLRNWPYDTEPGARQLLAVYEGRKFAGFDALMAEAGADALEKAQPGLAKKLAAFT